MLIGLFLLICILVILMEIGMSMEILRMENLKVVKCILWIMLRRFLWVDCYAPIGRRLQTIPKN